MLFLQKPSLDSESNTGYVLSMVYISYGCGGHPDYVTWTIYANFCVDELYWLSDLWDVYVQYLFGTFCLKYIPIA